MSERTHIRFRGDKQDTWAVSALNQIGPDDQAEIVYRVPDSRTWGGPSITSQGVIAVAGGTEITVKAVHAVDIDGWKGLYLYVYDFNDIYQIVSNTSADAGALATITVSSVLNTYSAPGNNFAINVSNKVTRYVAKSGSDINSGGFVVVPKLTIQSAIDTAVATGGTHVAILDSGVYDERLDLKGITVEAAPGQKPTITFPVNMFVENASLPSTAVQFSTFSIGGIPRLYAATDIGLYSSTDGISWSVAFLSGKHVTGCCVHDGVLYAANLTDRTLHAITSSGSISTVASGDTWLQSGGFPERGFSLPGLLAFGSSESSRPYLSLWDGSSWSFAEIPGTAIDCVFSANLSTDVAFFTTENDGEPFYLSAFYFESRSFSNVGVVATSIALYNDRLYGTFSDGLKVMSTPLYPSLWQQTQNQPWLDFGEIPKRFYIDSFGRPTVLSRGDAGDVLYFSDNNLQSWSPSIAFSSSLAAYSRFFGVEVAVAIDTDVVGTAISWDRRHIINTVESSILSGFVVDGRDMAIDSYAGTVSFRHCRVRRHYQPCEDVAVSVAHQYTRFEDMKDSSFRGSSVIDCIIDKCEFARFVGRAVRITGPGVSVEECTIAASGRGLSLEAVPKSVYCCIISGNTVDIDSAVSGAVIEFTCFETRAGLPLIEAECFIGNPLFVDDSGANLTLKSRALGYPVDSALLDDFNTGSPVDMRESIGARRYSRVLSSSSYGLDYMLHCNPGTVRNAYRPANYDKAYSQNGSMYGRETNPSAHKLARTLSWDSTGGEDAKTKAQAAMLRYIYGLDSVFDVGDSTDGTDFVPRRTGSKVSTFIRVSFGASDPLIAPNEHAGAWCIDEAGTIIGRIDSHTASYLSSGVYVIDITWQIGTDLPTATSVCKIDAFRRFRIDKTQPFSPICQMPYVPGIISDIPTQYDITLEEVDE